MKSLVVITILLVIILITASITYYVIRLPIDKTGCTINIQKDVTYQHPLILYRDKNEFIYPNIDNGITFSRNETIRLVCSGTSNHLSVSSNVKEVLATCVEGTTFSVDNNIGQEEFNALKCTQYPDAIAKRSGNNCASNLTEIEIGFETKQGFITVLTNCFDEINKDTLYSIINMPSAIKSQQSGVPRPNGFKNGDFYDDIFPKPESVYKKTGQRLGFERILGSAELAAKYISLQSDYFLSRGHLSAKAEFVYGSQQRATFFYVNVAPQWQTFNGRNWNSLEMAVRKFVGDKKLNVTIYTGVYGNAKLPNINNNMQNLSIFANSDRQAISVPEIYYKLLHDPVGKKGTVFIGHNNPYETDVKPICTNICDKIDWLTWKPNDIEAGFSYCCDYEEFKRIVNYLPELEINGLLT